MRAIGVRLFLRQIGNRNIRAFASKCDYGGAPDAGIATGHQRLAPLQPGRASITLRAMIGGGIHFSCKARHGLLPGKRRRWIARILKRWAIGHDGFPSTDRTGAGNMSLRGSAFAASLSNHAMRWTFAPSPKNRWGAAEPLEHEAQRRMEPLHPGMASKLLRWRPDKAPRQCAFDQLSSAAWFGATRLLPPLRWRRHFNGCERERAHKKGARAG